MLISLYEKIQEYRSGLINKSITINNISWSYYDNLNENKPILVILHGFQSNRKYTWYPLIIKLTNKFRIIIPDLPLHGETKILCPIKSFNLNLDNIILQTVSFIRSIIGINTKYHLIGSSFGGLLSCMISVYYPDNIISLTLYSTAGINNGKNILLDIFQKNNTNLLIPNSKTDHDILLSLIFYNHKFNNFILNYLFNEQKKRRMDYLLFYKKLIEPNLILLKEHIYKIKIPVLLLWGKQDNILNPISSKYIYNNLLNKPEIHILDKCGHLPQIEKTDICAKYTKFHILRSIYRQKNDN